MFLLKYMKTYDICERGGEGGEFCPFWRVYDLLFLLLLGKRCEEIKKFKDRFKDD